MHLGVLGCICNVGVVWCGQLTTPEQTQLSGGTIKSQRALGCARVRLDASRCARVLQHSVEEWVRGGTSSEIAIFITKKYNFNYK